MKAKRHNDSPCRYIRIFTFTNASHLLRSFIFPNILVSSQMGKGNGSPGRPRRPAACLGGRTDASPGPVKQQVSASASSTLPPLSERRFSNCWASPSGRQFWGRCSLALPVSRRCPPSPAADGHLWVQPSPQRRPPLCSLPQPCRDRRARLPASWSWKPSQ